jgi:Domain of unknown function DUF1828
VKDLLCKAFCNELAVRAVPAGLAVRTPFTMSSGEPLGFYILGPDPTGRYRLEDDGSTMPLIEAAGVDLNTQTRQDAVAELFEEYKAQYDQETGELSTPPMPHDDVPARALQFAALLLRLQDLLLLKPERAASTFREDAIRNIKTLIGDRAAIEENRSPAGGIEFPADLLIHAQGRTPVAVYLAMSEQRVLEAVVAQMAVTYEAKSDCAIIALVERDTSISGRMRQRAVNRLAAMPIYQGDEIAAVARIGREALGRPFTLH